LDVQPNAHSRLSFPTAGDVSAPFSQGAVSSSRRSHRHSQADPDGTASDDEADAVSQQANAQADFAHTDYEFEMPNGNSAAFLGELNGEVLFRGFGDEGPGLYRTDGDGTAHVWSSFWLPHDNDDMIEYAGEFYFTAASRDHVGDVHYGLYRTDVDEVHLVFPSEGPIRGPHPKPLGVVSNSIFVSAAGPHGYELMRIKHNDMEWIDLNPEGD
jgi:hypothetical protein